MTKYITLIFALCALLSCKKGPTPMGSIDNPPIYKKSDLQKLRWIEGNWKSEVSGKGFYQTYHFPSDSILEVVSYQLEGKDTSATSITTVYWKNNHLYIGPNGEWVAVLLDNTSFQLNPVRNGWLSINWTQTSKDEWTAVHSKPEFKRTIKMKRQPPLAELLKQ